MEFKQCSKQCLQALLMSVLRAYARTYERTNEELLTLSSYLTLCNARRGAAKFSRIGDENQGTATASRGLPGLLDAHIPAKDGNQ